MNCIVTIFTKNEIKKAIKAGVTTYNDFLIWRGGQNGK